MAGTQQVSPTQSVIMPGRRSSNRPTSLRMRVGGTFAPYLYYIAPFFIVFFAFFAYPVAYSFYVSLHRWAGVGGMSWVGWSNYHFVIGDAFWWSAVGVTALLWLLVVPVGTFLALVVAVVLNQSFFRGRSVALMLYLLPTVVSIVAASVVFRIIYDPSQGPINVVLTSMHLPAIPWFDSPTWARIALALVRLWESVGLGVLFFMASLQNISPDLYEAASIDGASSVRQFWHITLPLVTGTILFLTVVGTLAVFSLFAEPQLITNNGGPGTSTTTVGLYLFNLVQGLDFGTASAVSFLMTTLMMIVSVALFLAARKRMTQL